MTNESQPTLMVIDGHSLAFRAFFALPVDSFVNDQGQHTNAIHGFISALLNLLQNEQPTHIAVAFDISRHSFRTREYPDYKGTRAETPPEFKGQVPLLQDALRAMRITTLTKEDFEADDILATLSVRGRAEGFQVLVVSGDRDTIQLVNDDVTLLYPSTQGVSQLKRYTPETVFERYGIRPEQYPEVAALVGETSDNLPGIPKVGEKTAVKWINQFGGLQQILDHADEIGGKVGESFREHRENAVRNRRLNHLITDLELGVELDALQRKPFDIDAVREIFTTLNFRTLQERVLKIAADDGAVATGASAVELPAPRELLDEELDAWLTHHRAEGTALTLTVFRSPEEGLLTDPTVRVGLATETERVDLAWIPGRSDYAPFERWLADDEAHKVMYRAKASIKALRRVGLPFAGLVGEAEILAWLERPNDHVAARTLEALASKYLSETIVATPKDGDLPIDDDFAPSASAWYLARIWGPLTEDVSPESRRVHDDIELPTLGVLVDMELAGIAVDGAALRELSAQLGERAAATAAEAFNEIGREINLGSPKQLQDVLFDQLAMPKTRATKTGYSTDAESLSDLQESSPHPFLALLLQHRDVTKLKQIIDTLEKSIQSDGRVHTNYGQAGTATGRLNSQDPNLQNIPVRTDESHRIRASFGHAPEFDALMTADYSQIEMRIMAHLSGDEGLIEAFRSGEDLHRFVGSRVFGVEPAAVTPIMRTKVKAMSYGLAYGLSAFGLSKQLRIARKEAETLMNDYFVRFGGVRDYLRSVVQSARETGYTETIFGRRRPFPDLHSTNRQLRTNAERQALNSPIQGSAADIMKLAMVAVQRGIDDGHLKSRILLQVHDELVLEVAHGEAATLETIVRDGMASAADLTVPLDVSVGVGVTWDAAAHA